MSDDPPANPAPLEDAVRPLSVRMLDSARAQLEILAQLNGRSLTEEVRLALEGWIERSKADPAIKARAAEVRSEMEREAALRRVAIESIFEPEPRTQRSGKRAGAE